MSNELLSAARDLKLKGPGKAIILTLADRANDEGACWPSISTIAEEAGLGRSTVKKHLGLLRDSGVISWENSFTADGDKGSNRYVLNLGGGSRDGLGGSPDSPPRPRDGRQVGHEVADGGSRGGHKASIEAPEGSINEANTAIESLEATIEAPSIVSPGEREGNPKKVPQRRESNREISPEGIQFADWFKSTLPESVNLKANWRESFAKIHDDLVRIDRRSPAEIRVVCQWARTDSFWKSNFMSPSKLRDRNPGGIQYFDVFAEKMKQPTNDNTPTAKSKITSVNQYGI